MDTQVRNVRLSDDQFFKIRKEEVLPQWETGKQIEDLDECIAAAKELSRGQEPRAQAQGGSGEGRPAAHAPVRPGAHRVHDRRVCSTSRPKVARRRTGMWIIFSDSYTRKLDFEKAAAGIERSRQEGMSMLNGWPIVNFGVEEARKIRGRRRCP